MPGDGASRPTFEFTRARSDRIKIYLFAFVVALNVPALGIAAILEPSARLGVFVWGAVGVAGVAQAVLRRGLALQVEGDDLTWKALLRTVRVPLADVQFVGPTIFGHDAVIRTERRALTIRPRCGFRAFVDALASRVPELEVAWDERWDRSELAGFSNGFTQVT